MLAGLRVGQAGFARPLGPVSSKTQVVLLSPLCLSPGAPYPERPWCPAFHSEEHPSLSIPGFQPQLCRVLTVGRLFTLPVLHEPPVKWIGHLYFLCFILRSGAHSVYKANGTQYSLNSCCFFPTRSLLSPLLIYPHLPSHRPGSFLQTSDEKIATQMEVNGCSPDNSKLSDSQAGGSALNAFCPYIST